MSALAMLSSELHHKVGECIDSGIWYSIVQRNATTWEEWVTKELQNSCFLDGSTEFFLEVLVSTSVSNTERNIHA